VNPIVPVGLRHLVVAVDGSPVAEAAADRAAELALLMRSHFTLLTVVKPPLYASSAYLPHVVEANREELARREAEATTYIQSLAPRYSQRGLHTSVSASWSTTTPRTPSCARPAISVGISSWWARAGAVVCSGWFLAASRTK
jgi:nucleotide-binding universal stress UspA family protein